MKRILFVDDSEYRHGRFKRNLKEEYEYSKKPFNDTIHYVFTAEEAIQKLQLEPQYDEVFLDHDLGWGKNGMHIVQHICEMREEFRPKEVNVHSANIVAATEMVRKLRDYRITSHRMWLD